ncbi:MAG: hypothetical protein GF408_07225 [Candidatus Omnitrophica bacterium]|nr:hypothetical protein [Candidatus Omnitrophota bacterium]
MKKIMSFMVLSVFICSNVLASEEDLQQQINALKQEMREMSAYYERKIKDLEERIAARDHGETEDERHAHHEGEHGECRETHPAGHAHEHAIPGECHHHGLLGDRVQPIGALDARFVKTDDGKNTLMLHEAEVGVQAEITDWLFAFISFCKHRGEEVEIEEAYAKLTFDDWGLSAKPGKFFVDFGPENKQHFFDRRTITYSAMHEGLFGHEPWCDSGAQLEWRLPVDVYSKLSVAVVNGDNAETFGDGRDTVDNNNLPVVADWSTALRSELGVFRFGPSFSWGRWDADGKYDVFLAGGNAYYRLGNFDAQAELIYRYKEQPSGSGEENAYGYYAWGAYTVPFEYEYLKGIEFLAGFGQFVPDTGISETRYTPQLAFIFNDYAKFRATYEIRDRSPDQEKDNRFITQFALAF